MVGRLSSLSTDKIIFYSSHISGGLGWFAQGFAGGGGGSAGWRRKRKYVQMTEWKKNIKFSMNFAVKLSVADPERDVLCKRAKIGKKSTKLGCQKIDRGAALINIEK